MPTQIQLGLLANDSVNAPAIKNQEVTSDDIASNAVIEDKIASNAVTASKLSNAAVTSEKLQSSTNNNNERAVGTDHIKDGTITSAKIAANAVTPSKLNGGQTGEPPIYGVRAWVIFNGRTTPPTIPSSSDLLKKAAQHDGVVRSLSGEPIKLPT